MNKLSLILNAIFAIAIIILFILVGSMKTQKAGNHAVSNDTTRNGKLEVAYVNVDSLLLNYTFSKDANEELIKKQEDSRLTLNVKARSLQNEMQEFQRKLENNAFLSRERAEQEHNRLLKKQQDLQELEQKLTEELLEQQQKMSEQLRDTVNVFLKEFNKDGRYQLIISNTANDNILYAQEGYDVTNEIVEALNARCKK